MGLLGGKHHQEHHDEEAWLVSYADMMTLMFGFFVIMYSFSQVDEKKFDDFRKELVETFGGEFEEKYGSDVGHLSESRRLRAFQMLVSMMNLGDDMDAAVRRIEKEAKAQEGPDAAALKELAKKLQKEEPAQTRPFGADEREKLIDIALGDAFLFKSGGDELRPEAAKRIEEIAGELVRMQGFVGVEVIGHSDGAVASAAGPRGDNWSLSSLRAAAVARALIRYGVDKKALKVAGMGDLEPLFPERGADGRPIPENMARNRRVHVVVKKVVADGGE